VHAAAMIRTGWGNRPQVGDNFKGPEIFYIPWGHNKLIIAKCRNNQAKALFYVRETLKCCG